MGLHLLAPRERTDSAPKRTQAQAAPLAGVPHYQGQAPATMATTGLGRRLIRTCAQALKAQRAVGTVTPMFNPMVNPLCAVLTTPRPDLQPGPRARRPRALGLSAGHVACCLDLWACRLACWRAGFAALLLACHAAPAISGGSGAPAVCAVHTPDPCASRNRPTWRSRTLRRAMPSSPT